MLLKEVYLADPLAWNILGAMLAALIFSRYLMRFHVPVAPHLRFKAPPKTPKREDIRKHPKRFQRDVDRYLDWLKDSTEQLNHAKHG